MQTFDTGLPAVTSHALAFSPDGRHLAVLARADRFAVLDTWDGTSRVVQLPPRTWPWTGLAFTADGREIGFATSGTRFQYYDVESGTPRPGPEGAVVSGLTSAPTGKWILVGLADGHDRCRIECWLRDQGTSHMAFGGHQGRIDSMAVSADETRAAAGALSAVRVWDISGKSPPKRAMCVIRTEGWVKGLALSRDGSLLAGTARQRVLVWDAKTGAERFRYAKHKRAVTAVAFSPTRSLLVSGGNDGLVFATDPEVGKEIHRLDWGIGPVVALAFAPDGLRCAAAGETGKVVVWDVEG